MPLTVQVKQSQLRKFQRWAKEYFPNEILSALLGTVENGIYRVEHIAAPSVGDPDSVNWNEEIWQATQDFRKFAGLKYLGSIHTHPREKGEPAPSTTDIRSASGSEKIYAICAVWKDARGDQLYFRTNTQFYTAGPEIKIERI